jgi:phosphoglucosamine mutase
MAALRFGTDGVRALANVELTPEYALLVGRAAARALGVDRVVVGRDTRISGPLLEAALCAGFATEGVNVEALGVCPTPAVAHVAAVEGIGGAVVSASHNPFADNGIKLFGAGGLKLGDDVQAEVEAELARLLAASALDGAGRPRDAAVGGVTAAGERVAGYEAALLAAVGEGALEGLHLVLDCANGAASHLAVDLFRRAGAVVAAIADAPDGTNINAGCGSTHLDVLQAAVLSRGAHLGLAFDGDADRVLAIDHTGAVVDGDQLIALCALDLRARGRLQQDTVVVTVMSNLGFRLGMQRAGVRIVETPVGDRYVLEALEAGGYSLGGEQSGHVIFRELATTGDGLLTGLQVAAVVKRSRTTLAELAAAAMTRLPQVLRNVTLPAGQPPGLMERLAPAIAAVSDRLGEEGRVLVRPSGTEPLVRVMAEAAELPAAEAAVADLVAAVEALTARP